MEAGGEEISEIYSMLHLIFHRNKNQHGNSKWWKWLSVLKRTTLRIQTLRSTAVSSADAYREYLATYLVPKCYMAFTTVVADGQFSTLGIVLLATLARLSKEVGIEKELKRVSRPQKIGSLLSYDTVLPKMEDVGEVLDRDPVGPRASSAIQTQLSQTVHTSHGSFGEGEMMVNLDERKPRKKSRKKKDAIDDLFAGLV